MKTIGNVLWFLFTGLWGAIAYFLTGLVWCVTIIGIPFGKQCFKLGQLMLWPMGKKVNTRFGSHPIANIIWFIFGGFALGLGFLLVGIIWCITIIGIPFGKQCFKLAKLGATPFGAAIN
jgi:uncharacterized membrane protein YccF (DUF307 family)